MKKEVHFNLFRSLTYLQHATLELIRVCHPLDVAKFTKIDLEFLLNHVSKDKRFLKRGLQF